MTVPFELARAGVVMSPNGDPYEAEGVLNPASGRTPDGTLCLLPRLVAAGNVSRVGLAEVVLSDGVPVSVQRRGVVLEPDAGWERGTGHAGVEDPRVTWVPSLGLHLMTYVAYGPLGPKPAQAVSEDLQHWRRLGPLHFAYQPDLDTDLNLFPNKDCVWFPEPVNGSYLLLHRPMWDIGWLVPGQGTFLPDGIEDDRPGIWLSSVPVAEVEADIRNLVRLRDHKLVAMSEYAWEALKIGAGPPPVRVDEGWLLIHHGVTGTLEPGTDQQQNVRYEAGALLLDPDDPSRVLARTPEPLLSPEAPEETTGTVPNVVFPTAIEEIEGERYVFYGMADTSIGVARLTGS
jgi:beta-1,2-mannobiose phosphorylase / 1,2-beta-oligomannan phosphorylase